jgi:uncharacterized protein (DUF1697 family)
MLRGVNLGSYHRVMMEDLRALCVSERLGGPETYLQSGNVLFHSDERDLRKLAGRLRAAIEKRFGFRSDVILRTTSELRSVTARNPFAKRRQMDPKKLLVTFLAEEPSARACAALKALETAPEELHVIGRELYTYFPNGMARPTLSWPKIERIIQVSGTGRNWNSVTKMLELARKMEAAR